MSPPNKRLLLHVSRRGLVLWRKDDLRTTELGRYEFDDLPEMDLAPDDVHLVAGLSSLTSSLSTAFARQRIEVIVDHASCPGLVVDLGEDILPSRIRKAFVRSRFESVAAHASDDWQICTDSDWITGPVLSFAMKRSTKKIFEDGLAEARVRAVSIQPTWVWCWHQRPAPNLTGLFISGSRDETTLVYMHQGRPVSFDASPRQVGTCDAQDELKRQILIHGIADEPRDVKIVGLPGVLLPAQVESEHLKVETFTTMELRA